MKRIPIVLMASLIVALPVFAGDVPSLVNLGFSPDSAYFMFAQYGLDDSSASPYAEFYLVDTKRNDFVPQGTARAVFPIRMEPGQDPSGAFFTLYGQSLPLVKKYRIDHLKQGRIVYILLNGSTPAEALAFRDFKTEGAYEVRLTQASVTVGDSASSSFGISVVLTEKSGAVKRFEVGNPSLKRSGVSGYAIRQILVAPDERTLVFIVEKKLAGDKGSGLRYMVETIRIP